MDAQDTQSRLIKYAELRGKIRAKYGTESQFADAIHLTSNSLSRKLNDKTDFSKRDMIVWCGLLDIPIEDVFKYFF